MKIYEYPYTTTAFEDVPESYMIGGGSVKPTTSIREDEQSSGKAVTVSFLLNERVPEAFYTPHLKQKCSLYP